MVFDVIVIGKVGYVVCNEGDNVIYKVLDDIVWFCDYCFVKELLLLGFVKMSVMVINVGM